MPTLTIQSPTETPPGGWVYRDPNTEFTIKHHNLQSLFTLAERHRSANALTLPYQEFINVVCHSTPGYGCAVAEGPGVLEMAGNLVKDIATWGAHGFPKATEELIDSRKVICYACPYFGGERGTSLYRMSCKLCGCRGVKLAIPTSRCPDTPPRWEAVYGNG